jgi:periplasmic divalent cation tolerance protein
LTPVIVLTTVGSAFDVAALARELVEQRLAACVNVIPQIQSVYRWQGRIESDAEQLLLIKTVDERLDALEAALLARHPYEVPEFVVMRPDEVRGAWREWLIDSVR